METNQYRGDSGPFSVAYPANDTLDLTDQGPKLDRAGHNRFVGHSPSGTDAAAIASRVPFPFGTLIVCFTIWLIATQAMIFDQIKFDQRAHLIEQEAQSLGLPQVVVPNERPSNLSTGVQVQRL
jgi:hypothetical protein